MTSEASSRVLSSGLTFFYKFVFSTFWTGGFAAATLGLLLSPPKEPHANPWLFFLGGTVCGGLFLFWTCGRLKRVAVSRDALIVSNYLRTIRVPVSRVTQVSASRLMSPETIWLTFDPPTPFGRSVMFMPPARLTLGLSAHPMAAEVRRIIEEAKERAAAAGPEGDR